MDVTSTRNISNAQGDIYLFDLYKDDGSFRYEPCLVFEKAQFNSCWDNKNYLFNFFCRLKKKKKAEIEELKLHCKKNSLNYKETKRTLLDIFKASKQLRFWKTILSS